MLTIISPAKKMLHISEAYPGKTSTPLLLDRSAELVTLMKAKSVEQIAKLMDLSHDLAVLNYNRYQAMNHSTDQTYPAVFLFQGDVYQGLEANKWRHEDINYAQGHLRILSGLYGVLKPLDRMEPYRLEMGVRLANSTGATLYSYWQQAITDELNKQLSAQANPLLVNLASTEYFKSVDQKKLKYPVCTINFYEQKNNELKMIGIFAKKARGLMAKYIIQNQIDDLNAIKDFTESGYRFDEKRSSELTLDFIR